MYSFLLYTQFLSGKVECYQCNDLQYTHLKALANIPVVMNEWRIFPLFSCDEFSIFSLLSHVITMYTLTIIIHMTSYPITTQLLILLLLYIINHVLTEFNTIINLLNLNDLQRIKFRQRENTTQRHSNELTHLSDYTIIYTCQLF